MLKFLFGCSCKNYSFPRTPRENKPEAAKLTGTYVVCTDCGKEYPYDWEAMKVLAPVKTVSQDVASVAC